MTPNFSQAVDRVFGHVLDLLDRISRSQNVVAQDERRRIRFWIDDAEASLGPTAEWLAAKYALVAWVDEVLIEAPWPGRSWWVDNTLEWELFNTHDAYEQFYVRAADAATMTNKDALETFFICVVLGFRGLYRDASGAVRASQLQLPADLAAWTKQTSISVRVGQGRPVLADSGEPGAGAPPLDGKYQLIGAALVTLILGAALAVILVFKFGQ
jgi:type VI secretion system protein ImpK